MKKLLILFLSVFALTANAQYNGGVSTLTSTVNSSSTVLISNAVFTGTAEDISQYSEIRVTVFSDAASATDGFSMQQSTNGTNWDVQDNYTIPAATSRTFGVGVSARFFRFVYTNGVTAQTSFRVQTRYHKVRTKPSSQRPQDGRANDNDFEEELSFLMGYNSTSNAWNRVGVSNATTGGNENLVDRVKVNASLRMIDNAQPSGSKLVGVTGTTAAGLDVNIKNASIPVTGTFFQATQPVNTTQINGVAFSTGVGASDAGTQRFALVNEQLQDLYFTGQSAQTAVVNNIIPTTAGTNATDLTGYNSGMVQIICPAGTYTTGAIIFEGSNESPTSTNFQSIVVYNQLSLTGTSISGAITLVTTTAIGYTFPVKFRYIRVRISTAVSGATATVQAISTFKQAAWTPAVFQVAQSSSANLLVAVSGVNPGVGTANSHKAEDAVAVTADVGQNILTLRNDVLTINTSASGDYGVPITDLFGATIVKDQQRHKRTYRTAFVVASAATASDIFQLIGSATTTVEITKITISGTQTTGGVIDLYLKKRSTANTLGTSSAAVLVPMISTDAAATAAAAIYTANPTTGTDVGNVYIESIPLPTTASITNNIIDIDLGERGKPVILLGVAQAFAINLNGVTVAGSSFKITIEFTEF